MFSMTAFTDGNSHLSEEFLNHVKTLLWTGRSRGVAIYEASRFNMLATEAGLPDPCEVLCYLLDKLRERFSNGAVTSPPHKQNKTKHNSDQ